MNGTSAPKLWTPPGAASPWGQVKDIVTVEQGCTISPLYKFVRFKFTLDSCSDVIFLVNLMEGEPFVKDTPNHSEFTSIILKFQQEAPLAEVCHQTQYPHLYPLASQICGITTKVRWTEKGLQQVGSWIGRGLGNSALVIRYSVPLNSKYREKLGQIFDVFLHPVSNHSSLNLDLKTAENLLRLFR